MKKKTKKIMEAKIAMKKDKMKMRDAINILMDNDKNATWNEVRSLKELKESLKATIENFEETEDAFIFYKEILSRLR